MGVMISIHYDSAVVSDDEAYKLSENLRRIVCEVMNKQDVFVIANHNNVMLSADPIEAFVQINGLRISDPEELADRLAKGITNWKQSSDFAHAINLNVVPVTWYAKLGL